MKENETTSILGFFNYFKGIVGWHIHGYIIINFLVGLLDAFGLAMFVPLLSIATGNETSGESSLGNLGFLLDFLKSIGLEINLVNTLVFMIVLFCLKGIAYYVKTLYFTKIRLFAIRKIRLKLVYGLQNLSYKGFTSLDAGRVQNNMLGEVGRLVTAMSQFFASAQNSIMLITYVAVACLSNWKFALMVAVGGVITNLFYKYINKLTKKYARILTQVGNNFNKNLIQAIHNFKYLKATNSFKSYALRLKKNIDEGEEYTYKVGKLAALAESLREPMIIIVIAVVILIQINVLGGQFETILVSLLFLYRALAYLTTLQNTWNGFIANSAGLESVEMISEEFEKNKEPNHNDSITKIKTIDIQKLSLSFGSVEILKNISLEIPAKTSVALVGESGAGKTSLANIICGLQVPTSGSVFVGNENLYKSNLDIYRDKVGYITQEPVIFNDTIYNNITFWAEKSPENMEKFKKVLNVVSLSKFVEGLEEKENSPLGNNGILISGGQKQRISIARELYKDVELLIMDEATSALDSETEKYIKDNIDMLHGQFTIIIIAHRLSTIKNVDQVYLMEKGEIINYGSFEELVEKSQKFKQMVELQDIL